jgi:hypothetical protein
MEMLGLAQPNNFCGRGNVLETVADYVRREG